MPEDPHTTGDTRQGGDQTRPDPTTAAAGLKAGRFLPVSEAADVLGLSVEAVRGRIKRSTLRAERRDGTVYVWVADRPEKDDRVDDRTQTGREQSQPDDDRTNDQPELVEVLREQVEYLRDQLQQERDANRENRRIIAGLTQRIPQLEAPSNESPHDIASDEPQEAERGSSASGRGDVPEDTRKPGEDSTAKPQTTRPGLWQRIFGNFGGSSGGSSGGGE